MTDQFSESDVPAWMANPTGATIYRQLSGQGPEAASESLRSMGIPGIKYGMDLNGYFGGPPRLPFLPLSAELKMEVERLLADVRN